MLDYGRKLKKRKHEIDSTDVASVEAQTHVFLDDETINHNDEWPSMLSSKISDLSSFTSD